LPFAFTEHGALVAANILNRPRAVQASIFVMRAFIRMGNFLGETHDLAPLSKAYRIHRERKISRIQDQEEEISLPS
jgi:hypothetical protein